MADEPKPEDPKDWEVATRLMRGGMARSAHGEISEALYLTQSFAYDSAEAADARFGGDEPGFIYQRFGNPTIADVRGPPGAAGRRRGLPGHGVRAWRRCIWR